MKNADDEGKKLPPKKEDATNNTNGTPPLKTPEEDIEQGGDGQMKEETPDENDNKRIHDDSEVQPGAAHAGRSENTTPVHATVMFVPGPDYNGSGIRTGYDSDPEQFNNNDVEMAENNNNNTHIEATSELVQVVPSAYLVEEEEDIERAQAEEVKPYFQRREGQFTMIIVGLLLASVAILLGVFLSREGNNNSGVENVSSTEIVSEVPSMAPTFDPRSTLAIVQDRGVLNCGIEDTSQEGDVNLGQFNIDSCRAISASIFGNPDKINLVIVGADDRYIRLGRREVDVLLAGDSFTVEKAIREPTTGQPLSFGYPYYGAAVVYLGPETYVKCANDQKRYDECKQLSICAVDTPEIRSLITSFFPASFITFGPFAEAEMSLKNETCNVLVTDTYRIYGSNAGLQDDISEGKYVISDYHISRNLLSSVVRPDDGEWYDIVEASRMAVFRANQLGIRKNESKCPADSTNGEVELSFFNAPLCVGNALEVFQEHLSQTVLSFNGPNGAYIPAIDAPNFGSLNCDDCEDILKTGRLKIINERGYLNCAVYLDPLHNLTRSSLATLVNVKFCQIMS